MGEVERVKSKELLFVELPLPPTDNQLYTYCYKKRKIVRTDAYNRWRRDMAKAWRQWALKNPEFKMYKPSEKKFLIWRFVIYMADWKRDPQNHTKALRDGLTGKLYDDDRYTYVFPSDTHKPRIDPKNPRIILDPNPGRLK